MATKMSTALRSRRGSTVALAGAHTAGADIRSRRARELVPRVMMAQASGWADATDAKDHMARAPTAAKAGEPAGGRS